MKLENLRDVENRIEMKLYIHPTTQTLYARSFGKGDWVEAWKLFSAVECMSFRKAYEDAPF